MLAEGVERPAASKHLGHAYISTTVNRNSHIVLNVEEGAADAIKIYSGAAWC